MLDQRMGGAEDESIAAVCRREARAIITLDVGFSDVRKYPPEEHAGIVVMRLGSQHKHHVLRVFTSLLPLFDSRHLPGSLWVVDEASVRIRARAAE